MAIGTSTGNINSCSAGTIGARVTDGRRVFALSNNHVYALENNAPLGSEVLQPGRYDTNCSVNQDDVLGTLASYVPIVFSTSASNSVDAAIARVAGVTGEEVRLSAKGMYARGFFTRRACLAPWLHAFFAWNGETYLCCMTNGRMESLGNVGRQRVREVFHGEGFRRVREEFLAGRHLSSCHRCDLFLRENTELHAAVDERREVRAAAHGARLDLAARPQ